MGHSTVYFGIGFHSWDGGGNNTSSILRLYRYMDYAVVGVAPECKNQWKYEKDCWIDYGLGIITHIDITKEIATIYWFELQASSPFTSFLICKHTRANLLRIRA